MTAPFDPFVPPPALPGQARPDHRAAPTNPFTVFEAAEIEQSIAARFERLPLMPSGKVDRRVLPRPDRSRPAVERDLVAPRTPVEAAVASIWREVLNLDAVGVHDPFLELGGDSLLAARIVTRLLEAFHLDLPPRLLLETDTVASLATVVTQHLAESRERAAVERWLAEVERDPDGSGQPG